MDFFRRMEKLANTGKKIEESPPQKEYEPGQEVWVDRPGYPAVKGRVVRIAENGEVEIASSAAHHSLPEAKGILVSREKLDAWQEKHK